MAMESCGAGNMALQKWKKNTSETHFPGPTFLLSNNSFVRRKCKIIIRSVGQLSLYFSLSIQ